MDYRILVCDDDPDIRSAMRRTLFRHQVTAVGSVPEAMTELKAHRYHAVVSDFDLQAASDGLEFLQLVRVMYPDLVRFLVTGNTDIHIAIRAVNEGSVHRFFLKPWDDLALAGALEIQLHAHGGVRATANAS
jgi:DNA-binding NtrC family response regulator